MMERLRDSKWFYILLSVFLATLFWLYARAEQDPQNDTWLRNIPVQVTGNAVLSRQGLTVSELSVDTVDLKVEAKTSVIDSLRRNRNEIYVSVDVSKCSEGTNTLVYTPVYPPTVNPDAVLTTNRDPERISVTVEKLYARTFDIEFQLRGEVAEGYTAGTPAVSPERVVVSGPVEQVNRIDKVVAVLEVENLDKLFAGDLPLTLMDNKGEELTDLDVTLDSQYAYVVMPVVVIKEVDLTVNLLSGGGATAENASYKIEPATITISGAEEDVQGLTELSIGSIDLSKVVGTNIIQKEIVLDPSLENISGISSATVTISINGLSTRSFDVANIEPVNTPAGYNVAVVNKVRTVVVRGKEEALNSIDTSQIRIVADMSHITTVGTYHVPAKVYLDANSQVGVIGDYNLVVNVSR